MSEADNQQNDNKENPTDQFIEKEEDNEHKVLLFDHEEEQEYTEKNVDRSNSDFDEFIEKKKQFVKLYYPYIALLAGILFGT